MEATSNWTWKHAFVLGDDDLRKLWKLLDERIGNVSAELNCAHDMTLKAESVKNVLEYENPPEDRILSLVLNARAEGFTSTANVKFREGGWWSRGVEVSVSARSDVAQRLNDSIRQILAGTRPWFWWLARVDYFYIIFGTLAFAWLLLMTLLLFGVLHDKSVPSSGPSVLAWSVFAAAILIALTTVVNRINRWCFPVATFCVGQGKRRFEAGEKVRWGVVVALAVSVVASLLVAWL